MVVVILYKPPFDYNKSDNALMIYSYKNLRGLLDYFYNLLDHTPAKHSTFPAIEEIYILLYEEWSEANNNSSTLDWIG